ncbi:MAG: acyl-ACP--UDP-N-acetylglucosamine O-acyltransferase [Methylococcaceae bacterium]
MSQLIHPTAYIDPAASLGEETRVGPFAVIEGDVTVGSNCLIDTHAVIRSYTTLGERNRVHPHVVLGDLPQDLGFQAETPSRLVIGDDNVFREGFTAHRSSREGEATIIGSNGYYMNNSHVAHDCTLGDGIIFANNVLLAGHVAVGDKVFMGGAAVVHQFCRIGTFAIVQGTTGIGMDVIPYLMIGGSRPAKHYRLNKVALRRAGVSGDRYRVLEQAVRLLGQKQSLDKLEETPEIITLKQWLREKSKRGIHGFAKVEK